MVYVFFAKGFEEVEALTSVDVLRRAGISVRTVGLEKNTVTGSHGISVLMDITLDALGSLEDAEMLVLPGGMPGTNGLKASLSLGEHLRFAEALGTPIAAICAAPTALASHGIYTGRRVTVYPGNESAMEAYEPVDSPIVEDGPLITGRSIGAAMSFALKLVERLRGVDIRNQVEKAMYVPNQM